MESKIYPHVFTWRSMVKKQLPILLWVALMVVMTGFGLLRAVPTERRVLFSDQAAHISAALSIWHDQDLQYTLHDLERFRELMPAESGPRGAYLKVGSDGNLYYAKPFVYAFFVAPFVGFFGLNGFFIFNMVCMCIIGCFALKALSYYYFFFTALIIAVSLFIFSPFLAWTPIAHPDLFIAALLISSGFLLLNPRSRYWHGRVLGAVLFGLVIFEKPTFIVILFFLLPLLWKNVSPRFFLTLLLLILLAWALPSSFFYFKDGTFSAYTGLRFAIDPRSVVGTFPLEENWGGSPTRSGTDHIFRVSNVLYSILANLSLLPTKLVDFIVGRQTGMLFYFPMALYLLGVLIIRLNKKIAWIACALFSYLALNWLAFPTNGYGGAGTYGPRYTMQALTLLPLAFFMVKPEKKPPFIEEVSYKHLPKTGAFFLPVFFMLSVVFQYHVVPPGENQVRNPWAYMNSSTAQYFPIETSLLPSISQIAPKDIICRDGRGNYMYSNTTGLTSGALVQLKSDGISQCYSIVFFQMGNEQAFPPIGFKVTRPVEITISTENKEISRFTALPGYVNWKQLNVSFSRSFFDLLLKNYVRWSSIRIAARSNAVSKAPVLLTLVFGEEYNENEVVFKDFNRTIAPHVFKDQGVNFLGWSNIESWGMWSSGEYAYLHIPLKETEESYELLFDVHAYTPPEAPELEVNIYINDSLNATWKFTHGEDTLRQRILVSPADFSENGLSIVFKIKDPRSPMELGRGVDPRKLGLGLRGLSVNTIENIAKESVE